MSDTTTTTYGLTKPEIGASEDSWGTKLNANLDALDGILSGSTTMEGPKINDGLTVVGSVDATKVAAFDASGIATGTTRTFSFPNSSGTFMLTSAIGATVQPYDAGLASIASLTTVADRMIYTTGADAYAVATLTSAGRALLDDADASAQRTTLGLGDLATQNRADIGQNQATWDAGTNTTESAITAAKLAGVFDSRRFTSSQFTPSSGTVSTQAHGLGAMPRHITVRAICTTAEFGFSVGDVLFLSPTTDGLDGGYGYNITATTTNIRAQFTGSDLTKVPAKNGTRESLTYGNWAVVIEATL